MPHSIRRLLLSRVTLWVIVIAATFDLVSNVAFAQSPQQTETVVKSMLGAIQAGSLTDFVAPGDQSVKSAMTQQMLDSMNQLLGPRLKQGYTAVGIGSLRKEGAVVYLWKLEFKDEGDDVLVTIAIKEGKVAGFYIR
jgi:uncharacterized membrane-anchored protein YitT (DUF2179 family)